MKKVIITIIITIVFLVCIIFVKDEYQRLLLKNANFGIPALINKGEVDNLFIGSSMFRQGIDTKDFDSNSIDSYVLSYNGNQPFLEYFILNELLENKVKIKNVYLDMYAYSLCMEPDVSDSKIFMETGIRGKKEIYNNLADKSISNWWSIFVSENNEMLLSWPIYYRIINPTFYKGGLVSKNNGLKKEEIEKLEMVDTIWDVDKVQKEYLKRIVDLCKKNNINVIFIETPKYKTIKDNTEYIKIMKNYEKILKDINVNYVLDNDIEFSNNSKNYIDLIHLSSNGRKKYTQNIVDNIILKNNEKRSRK